jgi:hypothetical protein
MNTLTSAQAPVTTDQSHAESTQTLYMHARHISSLVQMSLWWAEKHEPTKALKLANDAKVVIDYMILQLSAMKEGL